MVTARMCPCACVPPYSCVCPRAHMCLPVSPRARVCLCACVCPHARVYPRVPACACVPVCAHMLVCTRVCLCASLTQSCSHLHPLAGRSSQSRPDPGPWWRARLPRAHTRSHRPSPVSCLLRGQLPPRGTRLPPRGTSSRQGAPGSRQGLPPMYDGGNHVHSLCRAIAVRGEETQCPLACDGLAPSSRPGSPCMGPWPPRRVGAGRDLSSGA